MANNDDDTVIYLDPKRSESMSLCQSYGDSSAGYGAFNDIVEAWSATCRFNNIANLSRPSLQHKKVPYYFGSTRFKKENLDEFQPWSDKFEKSVAKALEAGIWSDQINYTGRSYRALHKALFTNNYEMMKEHPSKYGIFETCLYVYSFIGYVALQRLNRWLIGTEVRYPNQGFEPTRFKCKLDQPLFGIDTPTKDAQQALDWLVRHRGFYELCSKNLFQVVCEVGIFASPITKYSRYPDAPKIPDEMHERVPMLYEYLDADKVYGEFLTEGELIEVSGSPLRLYSLYSREHYLGIGTALHYSVGLHERQSTVSLDIDDVVTHLATAEEYLQTADRKELEYQFNKCSAIMQIEHRKQWEERLRDLEDLAEAWDFINDLVHAIGFLATNDPTEEDVIGDQLAKLMTLPAKIEPWVTIAEGGPIQQLGAYLYQATNSKSVPSQSQPIQEQPSNELVERIAVVIDKESKDNGCRITDVARLFFGDTSRLSEKLREHIAEQFNDARYARLPGIDPKTDNEYKWPSSSGGKVVISNPPTTSIKYQEFIQKHWDTAKLSQRAYECKNEYSKGSPDELICYLSQGRHGPLADCEEVAQWLVENFDNDKLLQLVKKRELTQKSHKKSES